MNLPVPAALPDTRHLILPHASAGSDAAEAALRTLKLPMLEAWLARTDVVFEDAGDEYTRSAPHERTLARLLGWQGEDGRWPWAARAAQADALEVAGHAWGLITPVHWHVGAERLTLVDPAELRLGEDESRALFETVRPSFEAEGWTVHWAAPLRWYAHHDSLAGVGCTSLDRAIGRSLDLWLSDDLDARRVRRLQVEAQMLWHEHPVNEAREGRRELPVNSFWLGGCGRAQPGELPAACTVDERLRAPLLAEDWPGWVAAWQALDAGPIADLLARADRGEAVQLTLAGESHARTWAARPRGLWQRWFGARSTPALPVLQAL